MQRGLAIVRDPFENLFIGFHSWARREFAGIERHKCRLIEDAAGATHRFDPFAPVLFGWTNS